MFIGYAELFLWSAVTTTLLVGEPEGGTGHPSWVHSASLGQSISLPVSCSPLSLCVFEDFHATLPTVPQIANTHTYMPTQAKPKLPELVLLPLPSTPHVTHTPTETAHCSGQNQHESHPHSEFLLWDLESWVQSEWIVHTTLCGRGEALHTANPTADRKTSAALRNQCKNEGTWAKTTALSGLYATLT